ncbi:hypothetical protein ACFVYP_36045 [Kitasatospora sp. NPDC058201]|uniref:hypothetical protein n=1 Tax=unclassified Kitasatospora TaxID=2633591 RepID=UPI003661DE5F
MRVLVPERDLDEVLLADAPALTIGPHYDPKLRGKFPVLIAEAGNVFVPLTPRYMLTLADQPGFERIPAGFVKFLNNSLSAVAVEYIYARPGSAIEQFIRGYWSSPCP